MRFPLVQGHDFDALKIGAMLWVMPEWGGASFRGDLLKEYPDLADISGGGREKQLREYCRSVYLKKAKEQVAAENELAEILAGTAADLAGSIEQSLPGCLPETVEVSITLFAPSITYRDRDRIDLYYRAKNLAAALLHELGHLALREYFAKNDLKFSAIEEEALNDWLLQRLDAPLAQNARSPYPELKSYHKRLASARSLSDAIRTLR